MANFGAQLLGLCGQAGPSRRCELWGLRQQLLPTPTEKASESEREMTMMPAPTGKNIVEKMGLQNDDMKENTSSELSRFAMMAAVPVRSWS